MQPMLKKLTTEEWSRGRIITGAANLTILSRASGLSLKRP